jgi:hypothetical protein
MRVKSSPTRLLQTGPVSSPTLRRFGSLSLQQGQTSRLHREHTLLGGHTHPAHSHNGRQTPLLTAKITGGSSPTHLPTMPIPPRRQPNNAQNPTTHTLRPGPSDFPHFDRTEHGTTRC